MKFIGGKTALPALGSASRWFFEIIVIQSPEIKLPIQCLPGRGEALWPASLACVVLFAPSCSRTQERTLGKPTASRGSRGIFRERGRERPPWPRVSSFTRAQSPAWGLITVITTTPSTLCPSYWRRGRGCGAHNHPRRRVSFSPFYTMKAAALKKANWFHQGCTTVGKSGIGPSGSTPRVAQGVGVSLLESGHFGLGAQRFPPALPRSDRPTAGPGSTAEWMPFASTPAGGTSESRKPDPGSLGSELRGACLWLEPHFWLL